MPGAVLTSTVRRFATSGPRGLVLADIGAAGALCAGLLVADAQMGVPHADAMTMTMRTLGIVVASLSVAPRRMAPRLSLVTSIAASGLVAACGGPPQVSVCIAITAYTAASVGEHRLWWAFPAAASTVLAVTIGIGGAQSRLAALIASVAIVCVGWFAGQAALERRTRLIAAAEQEAERQRQHAAELRQAAIDERLIIARELHDIVAHSMSVIAVRAGVARVVMDTDPAEVKEALGIIETTTRQALHEMRLLVEVLRHEDALDAALAPAPGLADIAALVAQIRLAGVDLRLDIAGAPRALPAGVDLSAYRIAQEALTNVVRHAGSTQATLLIDYRADDLVIEVTDSGPAQPTHRPVSVAHAGAGHGLIGMGERAALFDGALDSGPHGEGFRVRALLRTEESGP